MSEKLCVICKHFRFRGWERGYSELTPCVDTSIDCWRNHWHNHQLEGMWESSFRELIRRADECKDYEEASE